MSLPNIPSSRWSLVFLGLVVLAAGSGVGVAYNSHLMRAELVRSQAVQVRTDALLTQHGRLLLERGAYSSYQNVDRLAVDALAMRFPNDVNRVAAP